MFLYWFCSKRLLDTLKCSIEASSQNKYFDSQCIGYGLHNANETFYEFLIVFLQAYKDFNVFNSFWNSTLKNSLKYISFLIHIFMNVMVNKCYVQVQFGVW